MLLQIYFKITTSKYDSISEYLYIFYITIRITYIFIGFPKTSLILKGKSFKCDIDLTNWSSANFKTIFNR